MPSEAELVAQFGVSRMTVNRALRELQAEGLVDRVQGVGTFAAQLHRVSSTLTIRDLHEEIDARGHRHHAEVHLAREERAPRALAQQLGLAAGAPVFHTLIVHHENGVPLQCEDRYVNPACAPDYLSVDFTRTTPTHYLLEVAPLWEAQYSIEASAPTAQEARLLGIGRGDALPGRRAAHREPRRADHARAAGASGLALPARRQLQAMSGCTPDASADDVAAAAVAQRRRRDARAARLARRRATGACASASPRSTPTARSRPSPACSAGSRCSKAPASSSCIDGAAQRLTPQRRAARLRRRGGSRSAGCSTARRAT